MRLAAVWLATSLTLASCSTVYTYDETIISDGDPSLGTYSDSQSVTVTARSDVDGCAITDVIDLDVLLGSLALIASAAAGR